MMCVIKKDFKNTDLKCSGIDSECFDCEFHENDVLNEINDKKMKTKFYYDFFSLVKSNCENEINDYVEVSIKDSRGNFLEVEELHFDNIRNVIRFALCIQSGVRFDEAIPISEVEYISKTQNEKK